MAAKAMLVTQQFSKPIRVLKWKVSEGTSVSMGRVILLYDFEGAEQREQRRLKAIQAGTVSRLVAQEDAIVKPGATLMELSPCLHPTIMRDMCAECGADLRKDDLATSASVPMVHAIPDLKVSEELAQKLGKADGDRLIKDRKLVLLVDLDQTIIHTTNDNIPPNIKDVYHFQLYGANSPWYHTRLRPGTHKFLKNVAPYFELHICTFGARNYAHTITTFLDADHRYFSNRILSRDECFDPTSKKANLKALFPCGDNMVCIIDDREDVWSHASNLIHVKPYHFFQHTGDINAPPGLDKHENDDTDSPNWTKLKIKAKRKPNGSMKDKNGTKASHSKENSTKKEEENIEKCVKVPRLEKSAEDDDQKIQKGDDSTDGNKESDNIDKIKDSESSFDTSSEEMDLKNNTAKDSEVLADVKTKELDAETGVVLKIEENAETLVKTEKNNELDVKSNEKSSFEDSEAQCKESNMNELVKSEANAETSNESQYTEEKEKSNVEKCEADTTNVESSITEINKEEEELSIKTSVACSDNDIIKKDTELTDKEICNKENEKNSEDNVEDEENAMKNHKSTSEDVENMEVDGNNVNKVENGTKIQTQNNTEEKVKEGASNNKKKDSSKAKSKKIPKKEDSSKEKASKAVSSETGDKDEKEKTKDKGKSAETSESSEKSVENAENSEKKAEKDKKPNELIEIEDTDDYLIYLETILKRIHKEFYDEFDKLESGKVPDLKQVIPNVRSTVLNGSKLAFSGLVPTHIKLEQSKAYQVARSLGAIVTQDIEADTTHLVAVRPGTAKVNLGRRKKKLKIVTPDWLWACAERWEHLDEKIYPLNNKGSKNRHPPPHVSPEHIPNYLTEGTTGRKRTASGRFMDTINPLMSFSSADIADMDKEVESMLLDEESDTEDEVNKAQNKTINKVLKANSKEEESSSSSNESLSEEFPRGYKRLREKSAQRSLNEEEAEESSLDEFPSAKFRRGEQLDSDLDIGQESNSEGSAEPADEVDDGEWNMMGAALEREFLSNN